MEFPYRLHDYLSAPTLVSKHKTLDELKRAARKYDEGCEGDWYPVYFHFEKGKWVEKNLKI